MSIVLSLVKQNVAYNRVFFIIIGFSTIYNFSTMSNVSFYISHGPDFIFPSAIQFCKIPNSLDFNTTKEWGNQEVKTD